jgi:hypothetical protein
MNSPAGLNDSRTLSLACQAHLEQEEALLTETVAALREVRAALLSRNLADLDAALARQAAWSHRAGDLKARRADLRHGLAAALGVAPQSVTIPLIAARLPAEARERLAGCRQRLAALAAEVDQLNRANAALVRHSLEFMHRFLVEITGGQSHGPSYTAAGTLCQAACGSLIEARG